LSCPAVLSDVELARSGLSVPVAVGFLHAAFNFTVINALRRAFSDFDLRQVAVRFLDVPRVVVVFELTGTLLVLIDSDIC
jgi:hypothetical protein